MRTTPAVLALCVTLITITARAQQMCPCVPISYDWIAVPCDSWNCVTSTVVLANSDRSVVPMPTASSDYTWVVLRRIVVGSAIVSPDAPFKVDGFDSLAVASAHFYATDHELQPMLLTAPDGKVLVVARTAPEVPRRRAVGR